MQSWVKVGVSLRWWDSKCSGSDLLCPIIVPSWIDRRNGRWDSVRGSGLGKPDKYVYSFTFISLYIFPQMCGYYKNLQGYHDYLYIAYRTQRGKEISCILEIPLRYHILFKDKTNKNPKWSKKGLKCYKGAEGAPRPETFNCDLMKFLYTIRKFIIKEVAQEETVGGEKVSCWLP